MDLNDLNTAMCHHELVREKVLVLTGAMSETRDKITKDLGARGIKVADYVQKGVDYLVQAKVDSRSGKSLAASRLGIPTISEQTMREMFLS